MTARNTRNLKYAKNWNIEINVKEKKGTATRTTRKKDHQPKYMKSYRQPHKQNANMEKAHRRNSKEG